MIIYCDGACPSNGKSTKGGIGIYSDFPGISRSIIYTDNPTNQRCELSAILETLYIIELMESETEFVIKTDSMYSVNCINKWVNSWKKNGWKSANRQPVKNKEIIEEIDTTLSEIRKTKKVTIEWVKAHTGVKDGNYYADLLANEALKI